MIPTYILLSANTHVRNQATVAHFWARLELEPTRVEVCSTYRLTDTCTCSVLPDQRRRSLPYTAPRKPFRKSHRWNPLSVYCTPLLRTWEGQSMYMRRLESETHGEFWNIVVIEANGHKTRQIFLWKILTRNSCTSQAPHSHSVDIRIRLWMYKVLL